MGEPKRICPKKPPSEPQAPSKAEPATELVIDSDVGTLTLRLDARAAPAAAAHFLALVDKGFYDGLVIHGARAGFAVQFGHKNADGYDDSVTPGLPHEVSPQPFGKLSFGMGAFTPGAHHSQIFSGNTTPEAR